MAAPPPDTPAGTDRPRPVRVLWLIKGLGPGGAEQLLVQQARAHDPAVVHVDAAYLVPWKDHLVADLVDAGVTVHPLAAPREWDLRWALRLRRLVAERSVEVVHVHSPYVAAVARVTVASMPVRRRPALVSTEHNRWPRHDPVTRAANRLTAGRDDHRLAVSEDVRASMSPRARRDVEVLVHGVDIDAVRRQRGARDAVRAELGIADDEVVIGTVANLRPEKGYDLLLDAAAALGRGSAPIRFLAVGQGPLLEPMRARVAALGLADRVTLLGYRRDAVRVMTAFDVFTLTSRHEGLPVALMDALALGLPVVATAVGGIPEVLDADRAVLVPPDDVPALAAAYRRIAADASERQRLADAAAPVAGRFDARRATERLEHIYVDLARARRRA